MATKGTVAWAVLSRKSVFALLSSESGSLEVICRHDGLVDYLLLRSDWRSMARSTLSPWTHRETLVLTFLDVVYDESLRDSDDQASWVTVSMP